jgi:hypothetical protein
MTIKDSVMRESKGVTAVGTPSINGLKIPKISDSVIKVRHSRSSKQKLRGSMFN